MTLAHKLPRWRDWQWLALATLAGLGIVGLPFEGALFLIALLTFSLLILVEPHLGFIVMLSIAPLKTLIETEAAFAPPVDAGQVILLAALTALAMRKVASREKLWQQPYSPVYTALLIFVAATAFSLPGAYSFHDGMNEWIKWLQITVLVFVVMDGAGRRWRWFLFGVSLAAVIQALIGIYIFTGGSGAPHLWILDFRYFRAFGTFGQPNPFGAFMGMALLPTLGAACGYGITAWHKRQHGWQPDAALALLYAVFVVILGAGLLASWSRGAWMGAAAALVVFVWLLPRRLEIGTLLVLFAVGGGGLLWMAGLIPDSISDRVLSFTEDFTGFRDVRGAVINDDNFAVLERLAHWQAALDMAQSRPLLGVGFGNYESAYPDFALVNWLEPLGHAHNYYLNLLAETGIVGLTAYFVMGGMIFRVSWRGVRALRGVERGVAVGLFATWTHITIHSLVDKLYVNNLFLHIGVLLGVLAVLHNQTHREKSEASKMGGEYIVLRR